MQRTATSFMPSAAPSFVAVAVCIAATLSPGALAADGKKGAKKPATEAAQLDVPAPLESVNGLLQKWRCGGIDAAKCPIKTAPTVALEGFRWGASKREVLEVYTRSGGLVDQKYEPQLRTVSPGSKMQAIEAQREDERIVASQLFSEFDDKHSGYDATFLWKGREYSYMNGESLLELRSGFGTGAVDGRIRRFFFFFGGTGDSQRLWKIYEELPLGPTSPFGKDFPEAVGRLAATFGAMGRVRTAGQAEGIVSTQIDWQDETVHMRLVERPEAPNVVGFVLEERRTLEGLAGLRTHQIVDPFALDPAVAGATSGGISDPTANKIGPAAEPEKGKKKAPKGR